MATREILILIFFLFYVPLATSFLIVLLTHYLVKDRSEIPKNLKTKKPTKQLTSLQSVKNTKVINHKAQAKNDVSEYQKIKTSETVLPVIKATVLEYQPGELGDQFNEPTKLYYSPEALQDKEFLESVIRSPWNTKTHELNTSEDNIKVSGWAKESWFDEKDKTVYAKGFLIGEDNIEYAKENKDTPSFGTSAFISFLKIDKESGVTPEGLEYNAIARKAVCNHVAILPNIRDEKNKIVSINAKNALVESNIKNNIGVKNTMEQSEFNALMEKYNEEKNAKNEETDKIVNAVLEKLEEKKNSKNEEPAKEEPKKETANTDEPAKEEKKEETANTDEPAKEEKTDAANALPNEKLVGVFAEHYGLRFSKTPTVKQLAEIAEIPYTSFSQALNALKKKADEISSNVPSAKNTETTNASFEDAMRGFKR